MSLNYKNWATYILMGIIFYVAAAASNLGFYTKWNLHEMESPRYSIGSMLNGTAHKPFVYRRLVPSLANFMGDSIAPAYQNQITQFSSIINRDFKTKMVYALSFLGTFLSLFFLQSILRRLGLSSSACMLSPIIFVLLLPYLQTFGGYYYDSWELMFLSLSVLVAMKGSWVGLLAVAALATFNKESYIFFLPCLWPFLREQFGFKKTLVVMGGMLLISGAINTYIKRLYKDNLGEVFEFNLFSNLEIYSKINTYFKSEFTYGLIGPNGANILILVFFSLLFLRGWKYLNAQMRQFTLICAIVNFPLFMMLGGAGEWRGLGFMYISVVVLMAYFFSLSEKN